MAKDNNYIKIAISSTSIVYIHLNAIRDCIFNYLGSSPTKEMKFIEFNDLSDSISISTNNGELHVTLHVLIKKDAHIQNNIFLIQERVKTAIIESTNLDPTTINVEIIDFYDD